MSWHNPAVAWQGGEPTTGLATQLQQVHGWQEAAKLIAAMLDVPAHVGQEAVR